jgi:hypothetical protein
LGFFQPHFFIFSLSPTPWAAERGDNARPTVRAERIRDGALKIDGRLDEPEWKVAQPATDFVQSVPDERQPASEKTEVRVLYDAENLYIGAFCFLKDARNLRVYTYGRDFSTTTTDTFEMAIDAFFDKRNALVLTTNHLGGTLDTEIGDDGATININWEGVWYVRTSIGDEGWYAEYAIPFRTLRYRSTAGEQAWGINFGRRVRYRNELSNCSFVPRLFWLAKVSMAGTLTGLKDLPRERNLKVTPFVVGGFSSSRTPTSEGSSSIDTDADFDGGVDVKYGIGNNLALDLTVRPDFSNVEADAQQVNLTRFSLFFPEKRPFFLENSSISTIQLTRRGVSVTRFASSDPYDLIPFFSGSIGLSSSGQPLPVHGGARLTGRIRGGLDIGLLNIYTADEGGYRSESFTVGRVKKKILGSSSVGFLITDRRELSGGSFNRLVGSDARFRFFRYLDISGLYMATDDSLNKKGETAYSSAVSWSSPFLETYASYLNIDDNFNPAMGYVPRRRIKKTSGALALHPYVGRFAIQEYSPFIRMEYLDDQQDSVAAKLRTEGLNISFLDGASMQISHSSEFERLKQPFFVGKGVVIPRGDFTYGFWTGSYSSDGSRRISGSAGFEVGDFYAGTKKTVRGGLTVHPNEHLVAALQYSRNTVQQPANSFDSDLASLQADWGFSPTMFFSAFIQYNSFVNQFSTNLRFNWIYRPLSNLFVSYNEVRDSVSQTIIDRVFSIKFTRLFQF